MAGDLAVCTYQEAMVEGDVSPGDEAKAMQVGIKEKSLVLRQKLGKLTDVSNFHFNSKSILNDMLLMTCSNSFNLFETSGEALCHQFLIARNACG
jgi:hypothetical protein